MFFQVRVMSSVWQQEASVYSSCVEIDSSSVRTKDRLSSPAWMKQEQDDLRIIKWENFQMGTSADAVQDNTPSSAMSSKGFFFSKLKCRSHKHLETWLYTGELLFQQLKCNLMHITYIKCEFISPQREWLNWFWYKVYHNNISRLTFPPLSSAVSHTEGLPPRVLLTITKLQCMLESKQERIVALERQIEDLMQDRKFLRSQIENLTSNRSIPTFASPSPIAEGQWVK